MLKMSNKYIKRLTIKWTDMHVYIVLLYHQHEIPSLIRPVQMDEYACVLKAVLTVN